jgi:hypothetical protein
MKIRILIPALTLFLSGCIGFHPFLDHKLKVQAAEDAKVQARVDAAQAAFKADLQAVTDTAAKQAALDAAKLAAVDIAHGYVHGAAVALNAPQPALDVARVFVGYADTGLPPLSPDQVKASEALAAPLVAANAPQTVAVGALQATQQQLAEANGKVAVLAGQLADSQKTTQALNTRLSGAIGSLTSESAKAAQASAAAVAWEAKHSGLIHSIKVLVLWALLAWGSYALIGMAGEFYPPARIVTVPLHAFLSTVAHVILAPIQALGSFVEKRVTAALSASASPKSV